MEGASTTNVLEVNPNYYIFKVDYEEFYIGNLPEALKGVSFRGRKELRETFPSDVYLTFKLYGNSKDVVGKFYKQLEKGKILTDFISNTHNLLIVSSRVRSVFEENKVKNIEFLPVKLQGVDNKVIAEDYYILHCLGGQDAIDRVRTNYDECNIIPGNIMYVSGLELNYKTIDKDAQFFRIINAPTIFLIRQDLLDILTAPKKNKFKGYYILDAEGYNGR